MKNEKSPFNKKLGFGKFKPINPNEYWMLCWYGRVYYSYTEKRYNIEAVFVHAPERWKKLRNYKDGPFEKITIPIEKTLIMPLGSLFDMHGRLQQVPMPKKSSGIYTLHAVPIHPSHNRTPSALHTKLMESDYPMYKEDLQIYNFAPYYYVERYYGARIVQIIIPSHIILDYFYGASSLSLHDAVYGTFWRSLYNHYTDEDGQGYVNYDGRYKVEGSVKILSKYLFTSNGYGLKSVVESNITKNSWIAKNSGKREPPKAYINTWIPVDLSIYDLFGQYISGTSSENQKFIVYGIGACRPAEGEFFEVEKIIYKDLTKVQEESDESKKEGLEGATILINGNEKKDEMIIAGGSSNGSKPLDVVNTSRRSFMESPLFEEGPDISEGEKKVIRALRIQEPNGNTDNAHSSPDSTSQLINHIRLDIEVKWFEIFELAILILADLGFKTKRMHESKYFIVKGSNVIEHVLMFELEIEESFYYVVEAGYGTYIPIICSIDSSVGIDTHYLANIANAAANDVHLYKWSDIKNKENFKNGFEIRLLDLTKHKATIDETDKANPKLDFEGTANKLAERISKKISKDLESR